jgi:hypothetical protein
LCNVYMLAGLILRKPKLNRKYSYVYHNIKNVNQQKPFF